ncbi:MAG: SDR family oxidoreductase [Bdellovibrionales bacterium]|jgi:nucleoside-diphosphate-sugar epimerase
MKVLVTGATGFIGSAFIAAALEKGWDVRCALRSPSSIPLPCESVMVGELGDTTDWRESLQGCEAVVHLAARVHVMKDSATDPLAVSRAVNTQGTIHLAQQAAEAGVKRFLFMSTIKVNGEGRDTPYTEADAPAPEDPYAISKAEAETALMALAATTPMAVTILRPPLVYGAGVRANFRALMQIVRRGAPLPFAMICNKRSLVYRGNLVSAMTTCLESEGAKNKTFLVTDGQDVSTPDLIRAIAKAMGRRANLWPIPPSWLRGLGKITGKQKAVDRLLGSLCADNAALCKATGWAPPYTLEQGLANTVRDFE